MTKRAFFLCRHRQRAEDLVQDTLWRALRNQLRFDGSNLAAWTNTIMRNSYFESRRRLKWHSDANIDDLPEPSHPPEADGDIALDELERAISALPEKQWAVVVAVGLDGMSYDEVAAMFAIPLGTVKSRLSRARAMISA